jgi:pyrimidine-nucleoside phosphorylase
MNVVELILEKRRGGEHAPEEIATLIGGYVDGSIPDYQISAWLMAACCHGLSGREAFALTETIIRSGECLDLSEIAPVVGDKHSTGGVGDKTTLVLAPLVAAAGLPIGKMSGRGLGFTGGTLDKLESIPGMQVNLSRDEFLKYLERIGLVIAGQSPMLCPADGKLYALRDVTGTVDNPALIASSVMSKKIAAGASAIVLDVKVGSGAFMQTKEEAKELARMMLGIGKSFDRRVAALITRMDQPLGRAVGNSLEVREAISTLKGEGPADLRELCLTLGARLLLLAGLEMDRAAARKRLESVLDSGAALEKLGAFIHRQGGRRQVIEHPEMLPSAPVVQDVPSPRNGFVSGLDALTVARAVLELGAGRKKKGDHIDHAVGVVLRRKIGDPVEIGLPLFSIHARTTRALVAARESLLAAYSFSSKPVETEKNPVLLELT